jgi:hypothetical protein
MSEVSIRTLSPQSVVSAVLRQLNQEKIEDAVACFTTDFRYKDHGIGLEFKDKERLTEFFRKARELYPDYLLQADQTFVSGEHVITKWTLQVTSPSLSTLGSSEGFLFRSLESRSYVLITAKLLTGLITTTV